jgi:hypothetical protein
MQVFTLTPGMALLLAAAAAAVAVVVAAVAGVATTRAVPTSVEPLPTAEAAAVVLKQLILHL